MVKKWIVMSVIILCIVGLCVGENLYIQDSFTFLRENLVQIQESLSVDTKNINTQENILALENLHTEWRKRAKVLKTLVWHTGMKEVEINLSRILTYTEQNDYKEAVVELNALLDFSDHYMNDFTINLENILCKLPSF